jgi:hypothetical protein
VGNGSRYGEPADVTALVLYPNPNLRLPESGTKPTDSTGPATFTFRVESASAGSVPVEFTVTRGLWEHRFETNIEVSEPPKPSRFSVSGSLVFDAHDSAQVTFSGRVMKADEGEAGVKAMLAVTTPGGTTVYPSWDGIKSGASGEVSIRATLRGVRVDNVVHAEFWGEEASQLVRYWHREEKVPARYLVNARSRYIHRLTCGTGGLMYNYNRRLFTSKAEAGGYYIPCAHCNP